MERVSSKSKERSKIMSISRKLPDLQKLREDMQSAQQLLQTLNEKVNTLSLEEKHIHNVFCDGQDGRNSQCAKEQKEQKLEQKESEQKLPDALWITQLKELAGKQHILLKKFVEDKCPCKGDQYGSWGPCAACQKAQSLISEFKSLAKGDLILLESEQEIICASCHNLIEESDEWGIVDDKSYHLVCIRQKKLTN